METMEIICWVLFFGLITLFPCLAAMADMRGKNKLFVSYIIAFGAVVVCPVILTITKVISTGSLSAIIALVVLFAAIGISIGVRIPIKTIKK